MNLQSELLLCKAKRVGGMFTGRYVVTHQSLGMIAESWNIDDAWARAREFLLNLAKSWMEFSFTESDYNTLKETLLNKHESVANCKPRLACPNQNGEIPCPAFDPDHHVYSSLTGNPPEINLQECLTSR